MMKGSKHSAETRAKMSKEKSGRKHPMWGKYHTEEAKRKISEAHKGKRLSESHKRKISQNHVGMIGKRHSEKTKQKMSRAKSGENHPMWGRHLSDETKMKISESRIGEKHWNWKGGQECYRGPDWSRRRTRAYGRDGGICQCCGNISSGNENDVHHFIPYRLCRNHNLGNLITLCGKCHQYIEHSFIIGFPKTEAIR